MMYIDNKQLKNYISFWLSFMFWIVAIMIIVGGLTRLTDSGLSITQWQLFSGFLPPLNESDWVQYFNLYKEIPEFKIQNHSMTIDEFKVIFWWEWIHRFLGRLIGIFFLIPLFFFSLKLGFKKLKNLYLIFFLICFQGFIGWYMVSSGLVDRVDVSHFRLSIHLPITFLILIFFQISIGAFVSGMDAGQIYNSWPLMGSTYFPDDNKIINLFKLSAFSDPSLVQFMHRNLAYIILIFYLIIFIHIYKNKLTKFFYIINFLGLLLLIQIILGILTLLFDAQIILASMHQISSIFLVSLSIYFLYLNTKSN